MRFDMSVPKHGTLDDPKHFPLFTWISIAQGLQLCFVIYKWGASSFIALGAYSQWLRLNLIES